MTTTDDAATDRPDVGPRPAAPARRLAPGLLVAAIGTVVSFTVSSVLPALGALTVAVVLGVVVGPMLPEGTAAGLHWGTRRFLRLGVVLLGLQLALGDIVDLGAGTVLAVVVTVAAGFFGTLALGRLLGVSPGLRLMVATGFSICGASAIAAMDTVTDHDREEVATAVTLVTLYGSAAIALIPLLGHLMMLSPERLGAWAGVSVHEVAQVVAAAAPAGAAAVTVAVLVKLTRVVTLAPMVAGTSMARRRRGSASGRRPPIVPLFVAGFLAMVALRSTGEVPDWCVSAAKVAGTLLFAAALFGLGSAVRIGELLRTGRRGLLLGGLSTVLVAGVGLGSLTIAQMV